MEKLGAKLVGIRVGMQPHTLFVEVLEVVDRCRALNVDLIITVGGGTLADAAKLASFVSAIYPISSVRITNTSTGAGK